MASAAQEAKPPRLSFASVDWPAAITGLPNAGRIRTTVSRARWRGDAVRAVPPALDKINAIMSQRFAGLALSPIPVLLPFDVEAMLRDQDSDSGIGSDDRYMSGFHAARFFYPGPSGYDAVFAIRPSEIAELADIKSPDTIEVQISGSGLLYELDAPMTPEGQSAANLEEEFPGIHRMLVERNLRYTFVRYGVPYVVSIVCFDGGTPRYKMPTCRAADQVAQRFLRALRVAGGTPRNLHPAEPPAIERPAAVSHAFSYYGSGQILSGTGFRGQSGRTDNTVYSQMRFPLADIPANANSQVYQRRIHEASADVSGASGGTSAVTWRDNFCERRSFPVAQCPGGIGHQGQDIRPAPCKPPPGSERCTHHGDILAVRDGVILRSRQQEAAYLFVNSANEHIRFRYLHMNPNKMDADQLLSGRSVSEGEIIGEVSNFSMKEAGTSYHLHFDIQVPTKYGWVFVNPYMTLVTAYEKLIGERGNELTDLSQFVTADPSTPAPTPAAIHTESERPAHSRRERHSRIKVRPHRRQHFARD